VAPTDASVMVTGETGTGKELVARAVHEHSRRREHPLIKVNCAAVPRELFESEFFGHVRGAFTGAQRERSGRFGLADRGTLFLDEIGEVPLEMQGKLLRVLQEGTYERIGSERTRRVDVRIIAATNRDLEAEVEAGRFRRDLYYRLNVFPLAIPPLRERAGDVALLARRFLDTASRRMGRPRPPLTAGDVARLEAHDWPGNVRELQNMMERAAIYAGSGKLQLPLDSPAGAVPPVTAPADDDASSRPILTEGQMRDMEIRNLRNALDCTGWRVYGAQGAAALLGMKPSTLASRIKKLRLQRPD
jgi:transcriptional regulator with GAF, ATPase, and Fis domain